MRKTIYLTICLLTSILFFNSCTPKEEDSMIVSIESGKVKGFDQEGTMAFLGIPYAKVERFMPPLPVDKWDTVRVCVTTGDHR